MMPVRRDHRSRLQFSLFVGALAEQLGDIEINEISVMKNDRFDRALHLVTLVTVRGDDVHDFAGNAVLVSERDAAERMAQLLSKFSLNHFARGILIVFQRLADVGQQRARDEVITLNGNVAAERTLQQRDYLIAGALR